MKRLQCLTPFLVALGLLEAMGGSGETIMQKASRRVLGVVVLLAGASVWPAEIPIGGRVVGSGGQPLAEAEVTLTASLGPVEQVHWMLAGASPEPVSSSRTDPAGRFRVVAPHAGHWVVRVEAPGHVPVEMSLLGLLEPLDLPDAELAVDAGLTVRLADPDGTPLEGGLVRLVVPFDRESFGQPRWQVATRSGFSGADGAVRLSRGEGEPTIITASSPGRGVVERKFTRGTAETVEIPAARLQTIEVRSASGQAIADALLRVGDQLHPLGFTDEAGRLPAALPNRGDLALQIDVEDGRGLLTRLTPGSDSESKKPRTYTLPDLRTVNGTVIDARTRRPIPGALVWDQARIWDGSVTNDSGAFTLHGPLDHRMYITARAPIYLASRPTEFALDDTARRGPVLALDPGAAVEGVVVDANGEPVPDAEVSLEIKRSGGMFRLEIDFGGGGPPTATTTERGLFRLSPVDPEKDYEMSVHAEGYGPAAKEIKGLRPYETQSGHRVELRVGQTVIGRVVDPDGVALADARITLRPAPERGHGMVMRMGGGSEVSTVEGTTDVEGRFEISGLAPGLIDLDIRRSGYAKRVAQGIEVEES
ncbi:MAG: carboxypeptidase regulatory-like domain-containing protein, partial [Acidobacteriota bacterium]|nr:carboxypeptidase regulatory-like domain-containing protein [Acidobacteriota bacterium]